MWLKEIPSDVVRPQVVCVAVIATAEEENREFCKC